LQDLCYRSNGRNYWSNTAEISFTRKVTVGGLLWAVARDVTSFTALVASLASSVERSTVRSGAVTGDVTELAACIAFHSLGLTIPGKVIWSSTFVTSSRTGSTSKTTTGSESTTISTTRSTNTTTSTGNGSCASWAWARTSQMSWLSTIITTAAGAGSTQT